MRHIVVRMSFLTVLALAAACDAAPTGETAAPDETPAAAELEASGARHGHALAFRPDAHPYGRSYTEWNRAWWRWELSIPLAVNPSVDDTGAHCAEGQSGKVWFLGTHFAGGVTAIDRACTIPHGKAVLVNLAALLNDFPCPDPNFKPAPGQSLEEFLTEGARQVQDLINELTLTVDGRAVPNLFDYRNVSGLFHFRGDASLQAIDGCITGTRQPAVSDGFFVMLKPLSRGEHTVVFGAANTRGTRTTITYHLRIGRR